jgi:uncharacterized radical SAM protein YgiQ
MVRPNLFDRSSAPPLAGVEATRQDEDLVSRHRPAHLPTTLAEAGRRGWDALDVVLVSGDAYVDHPSFAAGILGRVLEHAGLRVGVLSQPDWRSIDAFRALGRPRLFFGVTAGNVDSMLAHYTPRRRKRRDDPFSPGGVAGRRPDRATAVYAHRCREAYGGVPVVVGGIEASLRRLAHWDHWSRTVRPSMLISSKADLLVYGMGEALIVEIALALQAGRLIKELRGLPSTAWRGHALSPEVPEEALELPPFEACRRDPALIGEVTRALCRQSHDETLIQRHGSDLVVCRPPAAPPAPADLERWYGLDFTREAHPSLGVERVPALETVKWSVVTHRGCFGGCSFCAIAEHQGRQVTSRSIDSILDEVRRLSRDPRFRGEISDLGGPSANMYGLECGRADGGEGCQRRSCLAPRRCRHLRQDEGRRWISLLRSARALDGVKGVRISSGVRMDLLLDDLEVLDELVAFHVGGQLKVAPEHDGKESLRAMRKYRPGTLRRFKKAFDEACRRAEVERFLVAYLMSGHPGTTRAEMAGLVDELKALGLRPRQVQDFTPTPMTISTAQHITGVDPLTGHAVTPVRGDRARDEQRAMLEWYKPSAQRRAPRGSRRRGASQPRRRKRSRRG